MATITQQSLVLFGSILAICDTDGAMKYLIASRLKQNNKFFKTNRRKQRLCVSRGRDGAAMSLRKMFTKTK